MHFRLDRGYLPLTLLHAFPPPLVDAEEHGDLCVEAGGARGLKGPGSLNHQLEGNQFPEHPFWMA